MTEDEFVRRVRAVELAILTDLAQRIGQRLRGIPVTPGDDALREYLALLSQFPGITGRVWERAYRRAVVQARQVPGGPPVPRPAVFVPDVVRELRDGALAVYRAQADVFRQAVEGVMDEPHLTTRLEKSRRVFAQLTRAGVPAFVDRGGRRWALGTYTEMATRTATARADLGGRLAGYADEGRDLVIVSDSPEECERCRPFEGRVFSLSGTSQEYRPLAEALTGGLHHPNCRHDERPYQPGVTKRYGPTADPEGDKVRQEQRRLERGVRAAKVDVATTEAMARGAGVAPPPGTTERLTDARRRLRAFNEEHDRKGHVSRRRTSLGAR